MAAQSRSTNWFAIWVSIGVVVALALVAVLVITLNSAEQGPTTAPQAATIEEETGAIVIGDGENRLDTYVDFMCPICNQFEQLYGESILALAEDGTATVGIHPISILDRYSQGTEYSTRAANAMYCVAVADGEAAVPFMQAMFANQPDENTTGLTDEQILEIAASVGVTDIDTCVAEGEYVNYVADLTEQTPIQPGLTGIATPTVTVNGEAIANADIPDPEDLASLFE